MAILNNSNAISAGGYDVNNSLRFRSSASAYLNRTPASAGNRQIYTWSGWVKRGALNGGGSDMCLFNAGTTSPTYDGFRIKSDTISFYQGGAVSVNLESTQVFRDPSAWYHLVLAVDTTQATASNRVKIYVNGNQVTVFSTANYPAQNAQASINNNLVHNIAAQYANTSSTSFLDGYMADVNFIDGQALTPSSFGETDTTTGVWKPKAYTSTYGTNGFYLKFSDIATTSGSNAGLGKDFSGNSNYWTTNNISVTSGTTYDAMTDSPTNTSATVANYAVMNPLTYTGTLASGNLELTTLTSYGSSNLGTSTIDMSSGSWYWEVTKTSGSATTLWIGIVNSPTSTVSSSQFMYGSGGTYYESGSTVASGKATYATNDVIGIALNASTKAIEFFKNGVSQGSYTMSLNGPYFAAVYDGDGASACVFAFNFGQRPFAYTPPTGFNRLNTFNLPTPTILQGNKYMDATIYNGTGATQTITNAGGFSPDLIWGKQRSGVASWHVIVDSIRGAKQVLASNNTNAEWTEPSNSQIDSITSTGFTLGANNSSVGGNMNASGTTNVAWQWDAGTSTVTNTSGSITSTVSVNATAGFSVVTYTAQTSGSATVGHGLGVAPKMIITKRRSTANDWIIWHTALTSTEYILLNTTAAKTTGAAIFWNSTLPTSTVFSLGSAFAAASDTYVAYCFAEIAGFSKFGSYTGNGSADGPFVYLGFRPKFIMFKRTDAVADWQIYDSSRSVYNVNTITLAANVSSAESAFTTAYDIDLLSNGIKWRAIGNIGNASGGTYIYMAFAENPFKNSNAR